MTKYITYEQTGVNSDKKEITNIIKKAIESTGKSGKYKYVIGDIGGFAGFFDLDKCIRDSNREDLIRDLNKKYGEKRVPYIFAACWLQNRLNRISLLQKLKTN